MKLNVLIPSALLACTPASRDAEGDTAPPDTASQQRAAERAFLVSDNPGDLAAEGARLLVASQGGGNVWAWNPDTEEQHREASSISGLQAIAAGVDGGLWGVTSDSGVVGAVGLVESGQLHPIATQADDGTLFRRPNDLAIYEGQLCFSDSGAGAVFVTDPDTGATRAISVALDSPRAVGVHGGALYIGSDDGVHRLDLGSGTATAVDHRGAYGLVSAAGQLLGASGDDGIFIVGGASDVDTADMVQPGPMAVLGDHLYISDLRGAYVWRLAL